MFKKITLVSFAAVILSSVALADATIPINIINNTVVSSATCTLSYTKNGRPQAGEILTAQNVILPLSQSDTYQIFSTPVLPGKTSITNRGSANFCNWNGGGIYITPGSVSVDNKVPTGVIIQVNYRDETQKDYNFVVTPNNPATLPTIQHLQPGGDVAIMIATSVHDKKFN